MNAGGQPRTPPGLRSATAASGVDSSVGPHWVVDPVVPGDDLPPRGRSLFDFLVSEEQGGELHQAVPFPFSALLQRIEARARSAPTRAGGRHEGGAHSARPLAAAKLRRARILRLSARRGRGRLGAGRHRRPLSQGPALSRVSGESGPDRGHQLQRGRGSIRIPGGHRLSSRRHAADRLRQPDALPRLPPECRADIFKGVWDETNANPRVAALLASARKDFHGIPIDRGIDVPNAIDDATLRANRFAVNQLLWQQGCGGNDEPAVTCRAGLFAAVLQYRLSGQQHFDRADSSYRDNVVARVATAARRQWPGGLAIGNPDLPNRNPLSGEAAMSPAIAVREQRILRTSAPRSIRCRRARRSKSGALPGRTTWRGSSPASPISSPKRMWSASTPRCGSGRKAAVPRAGRIAASAKSRVRRRREAASASNSAARRRRPRPIVV